MQSLCHTQNALKKFIENALRFNIKWGPDTNGMIEYLHQ